MVVVPLEKVLEAEKELEDKVSKAEEKLKTMKHGEMDSGVTLEDWEVFREAFREVLGK